MKPIKLTIKDIEWTFEVLEDKVYDNAKGKDSHGLTEKDKLKVFFKESSLTPRLVIHELFHVYVGSCCINSVEEFDEHSMEEIAAEVVEFHINDILRNAKKLYNTLKSITENNEQRRKSTDSKES